MFSSSSFSPTAESFGVLAQIGSGVVRGGHEVRFHEISTRVPHRVLRGRGGASAKKSTACWWEYRLSLLVLIIFWAGGCKKYLLQAHTEDCKDNQEARLASFEPGNSKFSHRIEVIGNWKCGYPCVGLLGETGRPQEPNPQSLPAFVCAVCFAFQLARG